MVATPESMALSERLARSVGLEFDPVEVKRLQANLHRTYFYEIVAALGVRIPGKELKLQSGAFFQMNAFAAWSGADGIDVGFDEFLDFWLETMAGLNTIVACIELDDDDYGRLLEDIERALSMTSHPFIFQEVRSRQMHWFDRSKEWLELGHLLARAMIVHLLCHELGHAVLGHTDGEPSLEKEIEADAWAASAFDRLIGIGASPDWEICGHTHIDKKLAGAPMLLMRYWEMAEHRGYAPLSQIHPSSSERRAALEEALSHHLTGTAGELYSSFSRALDDLTYNLDRHVPSAG